MTTKADTSVKFGHSNIPDSPVLSGQAGALIALLDAFLIDGYCTRSVDSITVSDGVATVTISAGVPYPDHAVIALAGASPAALNDEWRIYDVGASTFKFNCPGIANGSATGTISAKMAPVGGWEKAFADTNKAAYRSIDPLSTGFYLRVDDTDPQLVRVRGYETMTGIDAGANPFPTAAVADNAYLWRKSNASSAATRKWAAIADSQMMYICPAFNSPTPDSHAIYWFGDIEPIEPSDAWATEIAAHNTTAPNSVTQNVAGTFWQSHGGQGVFVPRDAAGTYAPYSRLAMTMLNAQISGDGAAVASERVFYSPVYPLVGAAYSSDVRGRVPGFLVPKNKAQNAVDLTVTAAGEDKLLYVRGSVTVGDLRYAAFSLSPKGGWR